VSIRCAVIGYGMGRLHAQYINGCEGLELVAVCDVDGAKRAAAAADFPAIRTIADARRVFRADDIDLAAIVTPHDTHCPLAVAAAKAGKHVVTDKVMCLNAREAEKMIDACAQAGVMLSVFQNRRWDGDFLTVRRIVEDGTLGPIFQIESSVGGFGLAGGWRAIKKHMGGWLLDWGAHLVDQANILAGCEPVSVYAEMPHRVWDTDIETHDKVLIRYESGLVADLEVTSIAWSPKQRWRVLGEKGALTKEGFGDDPVRVRTNVGSLGAGAEIAPVPTTWEEYYRNVSAHLNKRAELAVKPCECLKTMRIMDAAYASAKSGRSVPIT